MLTEVEAVFELHDSVVALDVGALVLVHIVELSQEFDFNIGIINIKLSVLPYFRSDQSLIWVCAIRAGHDLPEGSFINDLFDEIPVTQMLTDPCIVEAILVSY